MTFIIGCLVVIISMFLVALVVYRAGENRERRRWYLFLRDDLTARDAPRYSNLARLFLKASDDGFLPEFTKAMDEQVRKKDLS